MPERDIYFGADATDAQYRLGDDPDSIDSSSPRIPTAELSCSNTTGQKESG